MNFEWDPNKHNLNLILKNMDSTLLMQNIFLRIIRSFFTIPERITDKNVTSASECWNAGS